jgi:hypothetical protein
LCHKLKNLEATCTKMPLGNDGSPEASWKPY